MIHFFLVLLVDWLFGVIESTSFWIDQASFEDVIFELAVFVIGLGVVLWVQGCSYIPSIVAEVCHLDVM